MLDMWQLFSKLANLLVVHVIDSLAGEYSFQWTEKAILDGKGCNVVHEGDNARLFKVTG